MRMNRSNETWVSHLRGPEAEQGAALSDLRLALLRGLRRALSPHGVDEAFLEDATQDALLQILARLDQFRGRSRFVTWATSIAIRVALSALRHRRWKDVSLEDLLADASFEEAFAAVDDGSDGLERSAILEKMREVIERRLTARQRTALLAELKGVPLGEIARHLGSNRNAVYKLTHDARKQLRRGLEVAGYYADDIGRALTT